MKELYEIQTRIVCPKTRTMKEAKRTYQYRKTDDIFAAVKPLLKELNCTLLTPCESVERCGKVYIRATAILLNAEGESVSTTYEAVDQNAMITGSQGTGSASTYAIKGALGAMFLLDDATDPDEVPSVSQAPAKPVLTRDSDKWQAALDFMRKNGKTATDLRQWYIISDEDIDALDRILDLANKL